MQSHVQSTQQAHIKGASQDSCPHDPKLTRRTLYGLALFWTVVAFGIYWVTR